MDVFLVLLVPFSVATLGLLLGSTLFSISHWSRSTILAFVGADGSAKISIDLWDKCFDDAELILYVEPKRIKVSLRRHCSHRG